MSSDALKNLDLNGRTIRLMSVLIYGSYLLTGVGYSIAQSPSLKGFLLDDLYHVWTFALIAGGVISLTGSIIGHNYVETFGIPLITASAITYGCALVDTAPYGNQLLGLSATGWLVSTVGWLTIRFVFVWSGSYKSAGG